MASNSPTLIRCDIQFSQNENTTIRLVCCAHVFPFPPPLSLRLVSLNLFTNMTLTHQKVGQSKDKEGSEDDEQAVRVTPIPHSLQQPIR